ncbi:ATPase [Novosphingobium sp.]|uniref:ATPase n=1 Tax=Novosphingobium sp. TaxID=1874826 RepID=UPI0025FABD1C|nr:ATPase [Novosphingobium sp.]MCC6925331.1 ATPase [Novosphingobium sp.]
MGQIALPLKAGGHGPSRIVLGPANQAAVEALAMAQTWPFRTAVLSGPPRSGKTLLARWFADRGLGEAIDDADRVDETELFHRWNRAQERATPLLLVTGQHEHGWRITLPDLASRLGAALQLAIGAPDEALLEDLLLVHAEQRGLALGPDAAAYLVPRIERTHIAVERLVETIDRLSLERKAPPTQGIWREALEELYGPNEPRLL